MQHVACSLATLGAKSPLFHPLHIQIHSHIYIFFSLRALVDRPHLQFQSYTAPCRVSHPLRQSERNQIDEKSVTRRHPAPPSFAVSWLAAATRAEPLPAYTPHHTILHFTHFIPLVVEGETGVVNSAWHCYDWVLRCICTITLLRFTGLSRPRPQPVTQPLK